MTKVKFSGLGITSMSGAIGDRVITRNFYGNYSKTRIAGPAVVSPALSGWHGTFSFVHAAYESLTDDHRNEWIAASRSSDWYRIDALSVRQRFSGFHLFMHLNLKLALVGRALIDVPPVVTSATPEMPALTPYYDSTPTLAIQYPFSSFQHDVIVYATNALNVGRMSTNQIYIFMGVGALSNMTFNFTSEWIARFGSVPTGKKIFARANMLDAASGRCGLSSYTAITTI